MSTLTKILKLFKYDPSADAKQTFNLDEALNNNWDKLEAAYVAYLAREGKANGLATLGADSKVPVAQIPNIDASKIDGILPVAHGGTGVDNLDALLAAMRVPKIVFGSYVGTGTKGSQNPTTINFDARPLLVIVNSQKDNYQNHASVMVRMGANAEGHNTTLNSVSWGDSSVSYWSSGSTATAGTQYNASDETYSYVALLEAEVTA